MNYKPTILYVEDEEIIRKQLGKFLNYSSSELYIAEDGAIGLELFKQYLPDIIVSDIKMPNMNGIEMVKAVKKINPKQHIIFTTAHSESSFFMDAIEAQVDGYILKPIELNLLEDKIEDIEEQMYIKRELKKQYIISNEIARLQKNLLIMLDKEYEPIFANEKFLNHFQVEHIEDFCQPHRCLSSYFIEHKDFFYPKNSDNKHWIKEIEYLTSDKKMVSILNFATGKPESFLVSITSIEDTSHIIITLTEITNISIEKKKFEKKAYTDQLTKIPNRAYFEEELDKEIARYKRDKLPLSMIMLDIDKFKDFNDNYGHQMGDTILKELSSLIYKTTRKTDTFVRWGGEEFIKILPNTSLENAKNVAQEIRKLIENNLFENDLKVTCSFGVAEFVENDTQDTLIKKVDDALYRAKVNGRNRVEE